MNPGEQLENYVLAHLPGARATRASGATHGDGDATLVLEDVNLSIECKDHKKVALDAWWSQARTQALGFGRIPALVLRRPPARLNGVRSRKDELLVVIPFEHYRDLLKQISEE